MDRLPSRRERQSSRIRRRRTPFGGHGRRSGIFFRRSTSDARSFVGTEGYLPPEGPGTPAADIFALGKVLYEALTGLDRRQFPELPADLRQWTDAALAFELNTILKEAGPDRFIRGLIELLEERRAAGQFSSAYDLAKFHAMIGNRSRALDYLELAVDEHRSFILSAKVHITFKDFQDEPRYHAVLRRLKLEKWVTKNGVRRYEVSQEPVCNRCLPTCQNWIPAK